MAKKRRKSDDERIPGDGGDDGAAFPPLDPRLVTIARAIGRLIAREQLNAPKSDGDG